MFALLLFIVIFGWIIPLGLSFFLKAGIKRFLLISAGIWFFLDAVIVGVHLYNTFVITEKNDVNTFNEKKYKGKLVEVVFKSTSNADFVLKNDKSEYLRFKVKNGKSRVPAGKYMLYSYDLIIQDSNGIKWNLWYHYKYNRKNEITINVNDSMKNEILLGSPMTMVTRVMPMENGNIRIVCPLKDKYNNNYKLLKKGNKKRNFFRVVITGINNSVRINEMFDCACGGILTKTVKSNELVEGVYKVSPELPYNLPIEINVNSMEFRYRIKHNSVRRS